MINVVTFINRKIGNGDAQNVSLHANLWEC